MDTYNENDFLVITKFIIWRKNNSFFDADLKCYQSTLHGFKTYHISKTPRWWALKGHYLKNNVERKKGEKKECRESEVKF